MRTCDNCERKHYAKGLCRRCYLREYHKRDEYKAYQRAYRKTDEWKAYAREYHREYMRALRQRKRDAIALDSPSG